MGTSERPWVAVTRPHPAFHARFHAVRKTYHYYLDARLAGAYTRPLFSLT